MSDLLGARLLVGAAAIALGAGPAAGQVPASSTQTITPSEPAPLLAGSDGDRIVIVGSRVVTDGADAPTPVTVVSQEQLRLASPGSIADALNQLPMFQNSLRPSTTGSSATGVAGNGGNFLNLRSLLPQRTLVLLDGRRVVASTTTGSVDINTFPQLVVSRVDVVTGGASAAYGSDAVAGVANFVLDTSFVGLKAEAQAGVSTYGDSESHRLGLAWGSEWAEGRGRLLLAAEDYSSDGIGLDYNGRDWAEQGWGIVSNPNGPPSQAIVPDVALATATNGGLITTGPLANTQFLAGGMTAPFRTGTFLSAQTMSGGDGGRGRTNLTTSVNTTSLLARGSYEFSQSVNLIGQATYADVSTNFPTGINQQLGANAVEIFSGNPFIPAALQLQMTTQGVSSFRLGRYSVDFGPQYGTPENQVATMLVGLEGEVTDDWSYTAYLSRGESRSKLRTERNWIHTNYHAAADAVIDPATGRIVCRTALTHGNTDCVPINLFGEGAPSQEAIDYVVGTTAADLSLVQDVAAFDLRGDLLQLPAGPLAVAFGAEYRRESAEQTVDPISSRVNPTRAASGIRGLPTGIQGAVGGFWVGNPQPLSGEFDVTEGFVEVQAPLLENVPLAHSLSVNGAVRYAEYSTAGDATTWKAGVVWEPVDGLRLRATQSRDIRAPNLAELYTSRQQTSGNAVRDPEQANRLYTVNRIIVGNQGLAPEEADTFTAGIVFEPAFIPGLTASIDYYSIDIGGAITSTATQDVINFCYNGDTLVCRFIERDPASGNITQVTTPGLNLDSLQTAGADYEISYSTEFLGGDLRLRGIATNVDKLTSISATGVTTDRAGVVGIVGNAAPNWRGQVSATWRQGPLRVFVQERYIGGGLKNKELTAALLAPEQNDTDERFYTDATLSYDFEAGSQIVTGFVSVNNLFDQDPPIVPTGAITVPRATNGYLYDVVGRYITTGFRLEF